ncbi:MAG: WecB/TagA/CpsF family glycosyltransferase [Bacteroidales bacterium]
MTTSRVKLLNIEIDNLTRNELLARLQKGVVITPNADHLVKLQKDKEFYDIYQKAEFIVLDSTVLFRAMKFLGTPVKEVITGSDLFPAFYQYHKNNEDIKIFLLGAGPGVAQTALEKINSKVGREMVVGCFSPSFGFEKRPEECNEIIKVIRQSGANVVAVGLGAPKQEKWIYASKDQLPEVDIYLAIGATIDFEAGNVKRAPAFFRRNALEWLYRLFSEPGRLWKRYLVDDLPVFRLLYKQKRGSYVNPFS